MLITFSGHQISAVKVSFLVTNADIPADALAWSLDVDGVDHLITWSPRPVGDWDVSKELFGNRFLISAVELLPCFSTSSLCFFPFMTYQSWLAMFDTSNVFIQTLYFVLHLSMLRSNHNLYSVFSNHHSLNVHFPGMFPKIAYNLCLSPNSERTVIFLRVQFKSPVHISCYMSLHLFCARQQWTV